jgi:hypothetical protein
VAGFAESFEPPIIIWKWSYKTCKEHNLITAPPVKSTSVMFMANSIETIEIKDIPIAVLKACRSSICLLKMKVSSIIDVIIPFIIARAMISHTGQSISIN